MSTRKDAGDRESQKDRTISSYPKALFPDSTPYKSIDFHPRVKVACNQASNGNLNLKMLKIVLVGDIAAGKTCLIQRFCTNIFDSNYRATIGVDFEVEKFNVLSVPATLHVWDTAGQERFRCIAASYYRGANAVVVCFDVSCLETLRNAKMWMDEACENIQMDDPVRFLVGCKKDLKTGAALGEAEVCAGQVANELKAELWLTSAKSGENVKEFYFRLMSVLFDRAVLRHLDTYSQQSKQIADTNTVKVQSNRSEQKGLKSKVNCCK